MSYQGDIIEESLGDKNILKEFKIIDTKVEQVTKKHQTPDLKQWTLHTVEIEERKAREIAGELEKVLLDGWYADYKNELTHYIIFKGKIFCIDRRNRKEYEEASQYGISLGIPDYQVNFTKNLIRQ